MLIFIVQIELVIQKEVHSGIVIILHHINQDLLQIKRKYQRIKNKTSKFFNQICWNNNDNNSINNYDIDVNNDNMIIMTIIKENDVKNKNKSSKLKFYTLDSPFDRFSFALSKLNYYYFMIIFFHYFVLFCFVSIFPIYHLYYHDYNCLYQLIIVYLLTY